MHSSSLSDYNSLPSYSLLALCIAVLLCVLHATVRSPKSSFEGFPTAPRDPWIGSFAFFRAPFAFLRRMRDEGGHRGFWIFGHEALLVRGAVGCNAFFSKGLDFAAGYRLLSSQIDEVMPDQQLKGDESWASFTAAFVRTDILERMMPTMVDDITRTVTTWGTEGALDPFDSIYEIIFLLSTRLTMCAEFCSDRTKLRTLMHIFADLEAGSTPSSSVLSWVPTPARVRRLIAGIQLYRMISGVVRARKEEGRREEDPLQIVIDKGFTLTDITRFLTMALFSASTNTGNICCWFIIYSQLNPEWKARIQSEIDGFIEAHSTAPPTQLFTFDSISDGLKISGPDFLEQATPTLHAAMHETIRLVTNGFLIRRNMGAPLSLSPPHYIPTGSFIFFPTADMNLSPTLYPEPTEFDPARFLNNPEATNPTRFIGWGAGRHMCVGRRMALTTMSAVTIMVLGAFDVRIVDEDGKTLQKAPRPREDALFRVERCVEGVKVVYRRRVKE